MIVRDATESDVPAILAIYNDVLATSTAIFSEIPATLDERLQWLRARKALGYSVLVATDDSGVLGFASFGDFRSWPGYRYTVEHSVHVRADARGRGIGGALVRVLLERATALGKHVMVAGVDADNVG
ncbi:MAG TPA: GNAT family N-acetyltransferase [Myxococcaceae bacterium]